MFEEDEFDKPTFENYERRINEFYLFLKDTQLEINFVIDRYIDKFEQYLFPEYYE